MENKHKKNFEKITELLFKYKNNDIKDFEIVDELKNIDLLDLFRALYFEYLESESYRKEYNKIRNDKYRN